MNIKNKDAKNQQELLENFLNELVNSTLDSDKKNFYFLTSILFLVLPMFLIFLVPGYLFNENVQIQTNINKLITFILLLSFSLICFGIMFLRRTFVYILSDSLKGNGGKYTRFANGICFEDEEEEFNKFNSIKNTVKFSNYKIIKKDTKTILTEKDFFKISFIKSTAFILLGFLSLFLSLFFLIV